jgi:hypothetical protein
MEFLLCPEMFVTGTSSDRERPSRVTETPPERPAKESPGANVLQLKSVAGRYVTGWMDKWCVLLQHSTCSMTPLLIN